jgi:hypothetical protein
MNWMESPRMAEQERKEWVQRAWQRRGHTGMPTMQQMIDDAEIDLYEHAQRWTTISYMGEGPQRYAADIKLGPSSYYSGKGDTESEAVEEAYLAATIGRWFWTAWAPARPVDEVIRQAGKPTVAAASAGKE